MSEYFVKYRPLALGLSMTGSGVANIAFPWITTALISEFGWRGLRKINCSLVFLRSLLLFCNKAIYLNCNLPFVGF